MDTIPLPPRPNLDQYRKRAKELVAAAKSGDDAVARWAAEWLAAVARLLDVELTPFVRDSFDRAVQRIESRVKDRREPRHGSSPGQRNLSLADAQYLLAEAHGFASWGALSAHIEGPRDAQEILFERAADAIVDGDVGALRSLLHEHPELIAARSARVHRVTLLHYVAANGVEDFRQKTPKNALEVARFLLERGAQVDATAETYGGGRGQTTMNLLVSSTHPHDAGLQSQLAELLLDYGAAINGLEDDGSPIMTALGFWYGDTAATLARRGARLDNAVVAAAVGRLDVVAAMVKDATTLSPAVRWHDTLWFKVPRNPVKHIEWAAAKAVQFQRREVIEYLLGVGVSPMAKDGDDMTLLHWAGATGNLALIERLLREGASLDAVNAWGGNVLNSTAHIAYHSPTPGVDYLASMAALVAAGADPIALDEYPPGNAAIDALRTARER